ncbi:sigma factor [Streptomyces anulatus]
MPITVEEFATARPYLLSVAHRMLGSAQDAQDAVQTAWVRAATARSSASVENPSAWLTTVTARVCLASCAPDAVATKRRCSRTPSRRRTWPRTRRSSVPRTCPGR